MELESTVPLGDGAWALEQCGEAVAASLAHETAKLAARVTDAVRVRGSVRGGDGGDDPLRLLRERLAAATAPLCAGVSPLTHAATLSVCRAVRDRLLPELRKELARGGTGRNAVRRVQVSQSWHPSTQSWLQGLPALLSTHVLSSDIHFQNPMQRGIFESRSARRFGSRERVGSRHDDPLSLSLLCRVCTDDR